MYEFRHEPFEGNAEFFNGYERDSCPFCGARVVKFGHNKDGVQRYRCGSCRKVSTPATGTIFDDGKLPRGLSRNKICIAVDVDDSGRSVFVNEGKGMTTTERTWAALGTRIAEGTHVVHDMETAHNKLVKELKLVSETHNGKALMGVPDKQNPLRPVNHMCFLLKTFLRSHSGFDRDDLDGYLNLFHVIMNEPENKLEKAAMVLDRAMRCPKTVRFREFYNVKPRSER